MIAIRIGIIAWLAIVLLAAPACDTAAGGLAPEGLAPPDGIDPKDPKIERSTFAVDVTGINTIRVDIPTGRVSISQSAGEATLRVTEIILKEGLNNEALTTTHSQSSIIAERSFVDHSRLDIESSIANGLNTTDIAFDISLVIPAGANIEVFMDNGPVAVSDLVGDVEINTHNGAVTVRSIVGDVVAKTTNRPIEAVDLLGNLDAQTTDADVDMRLTPPSGGHVIASTTEGAVRLTVPKTTAAALQLTASGGAIAADLNGFVLTGVSTGDGLLKAVLNSGGGQIEVSTSNNIIEFAGM